MLEMRNFLQKKINKKGFTLAELLVVVAIIAILVAVSIPIFSGRLEKSRESTDVANMRAAKAVAVNAILNEEVPDAAGGVWTISGGKATAYYDADNGKLVQAKPANGYGQGTTKAGGATYTGYVEGTSYKDKVIKVEVTVATDEVALTWEDKN